ncbi:MAG: hypothetical protein AMXMBFR33_51480 [Candidatus Xenobia bacterium]
MSLTRRQLLQTALCGALGVAAGCGTSTVSPVQPVPPLPAVSPFPQPPVLSSRDGVLATELVAANTPSTIAGRSLLTSTYNGMIPGPTLRVRQGELLNVRFQNQLPVSNQPAPANPNLPPQNPSITNLHTHGFHVTPQDPGDNVLLTLAPGAVHDYSYQLPGNHPAGTYWYHPHNHGSVSVQMFGGMAGAILIEGEIDQVPEIAAARDIVMIQQVLRVDSSGRVPPLDFSTFFNDTEQIALLNGLVNPTLEMLPGEVVRVRFINAGVAAFILLALEQHTLFQIAADGNNFPQPVELSQILLGNANRADFLIRAGQPGTYALQSLSHDQGFGPTQPFTMATVKVLDAPPIDMGIPTSLPVSSLLRFIEPEEVTNRRQLTFEVIPPQPDFPIAGFEIDGQKFDPDRIDQLVELGAVEEWTVFNTTPFEHPFHIHVNPFLVIEQNGVPLATPVWRDTIILPAMAAGTPGSITFRTRFLDFEGVYVLHCHILTHECVGMMQTVSVVPPGLSRQETERKLAQHRQQMAGLKPDEFCGPLPRPNAWLRWGGPS